MHLRELGNPKANRPGYRNGDTTALDLYRSVLLSSGGRSALRHVTEPLDGGAVALVVLRVRPRRVPSPPRGRRAWLPLPGSTGHVRVVRQVAFIGMLSTHPCRHLHPPVSRGWEPMATVDAARVCNGNGLSGGFHHARQAENTVHGVSLAGESSACGPGPAMKTGSSERPSSPTSAADAWCGAGWTGLVTRFTTATLNNRPRKTLGWKTGLPSGRVVIVEASAFYGSGLGGAASVRSPHGRSGSGLLRGRPAAGKVQDRAGVAVTG